MSCINKDCECEINKLKSRIVELQYELQKEKYIWYNRNDLEKQFEEKRNNIMKELNDFNRTLFIQNREFKNTVLDLQTKLYDLENKKV
jgi:hypothetical protein